MTKTYEIQSAAGVVLGEYQGETPEQAMAAMMADAGSDETPDADLIVKEV